MANKDHLATPVSIVRKQKRDLKKEMASTYQAAPPVVTRGIDQIGIVARTTDEVKDIAFPILEDINDLTDNTQTAIAGAQATISVFLDKADTSFQRIKLDDNAAVITDFIVDFIGLAKNKALQFIADIETVFAGTPSIVFQANGVPITLAGLPSAFGDTGTNNFKLQISAIDTPIIESYEVLNGASGSGGGEFFGPWTANHLAGDFSLIGLQAIAFTDIGGQIAVADDAAGFNFVTTTDRPFRFTPNSTNVLDIDDGGLTFLGAAKFLDMAGNTIDNVGLIEFSEIGRQITDDVNGMRFILPDSGDTFNFTINSTLHFSLEDFFANWFDTVQQYNERSDPASPAAGDTYLYAKLDSGIAKLFYRQSDTTIVGPLGSGITSFIGFTADANLNMGNFDITNVQALAWNDIGAQIAVADDAAGFNFVFTTAARPFRFTPSSTNVLDIVSGGLTFLGASKILDLAGNDIDNVGILEFATANITITSTTSGMDFSLPDAAYTFDFTINSTLHLSLEDFFANWAQTVQQYTTRTDPAPPLAGDVYLYTKTGLGGFASVFQIQSDGTITDLGAAGGGGSSNEISQLNSRVTVTDTGTDGLITFVTDGFQVATMDDVVGLVMSEDIDMQTNQINFGATTRNIADDVIDNGIAVTHPTGEQFNLKWATSLEYHFTETEFDMHNNDLLMNSGNDLIWRIGTGPNQTRIHADG